MILPPVSVSDEEMETGGADVAHDAIQLVFPPAPVLYGLPAK